MSLFYFRTRVYIIMFYCSREHNDSFLLILILFILSVYLKARLGFLINNKRSLFQHGYLVDRRKLGWNVGKHICRDSWRIIYELLLMFNWIKITADETLSWLACLIWIYFLSNNNNCMKCSWVGSVTLIMIKNRRENKIENEINWDIDFCSNYAEIYNERSYSFAATKELML